jgi:uncharacterized protein YfaS (alpha-2-macroglobulin family)
MEAKLQCFENRMCTKELTMLPDGSYSLGIKQLSSNNDSEYKRYVYVKNTGTHKAYTVKLTKVSADAVTIAIDKSELLVGETAKITIDLPVTMGSTTDVDLVFKLEYDNL